MSPLPELRTLRTGLPCPHDGRAPCCLNADHLRALGTDPPQLLQLIPRLPHPHQPGTPARGVHHHLRQRPPELLGKLVSHGLLPFDAVRLLQRRQVKPAVLACALRHTHRAVGDQPIEQLKIGSESPDLLQDRAGRVTRTHHVSPHPRRGGICSGRAPGIARRRQSDLTDPKFARA